MQLESGLDGSVAAGRVGVSTSRRLLEGGAITNRRKYKNLKTKKRPQRRLNVDNSDNSEAAKLAFTIEVSEHSSRAIKVRANFAQPGAVSALGPDEFSFKVKELSLFKSVANPKKVLDKNSFPGGEPSISKAAPPMIKDEAQATSITDSADNAGVAVNALSSGNFVLSLILGGSMQQLWGMIRALQMIILIALADVPIPSHTFIFFQSCLVFAEMDILGGEQFFEDNFEFTSSSPLNAAFELFNIGDKNFVMNSASYFLI